MLFELDCCDVVQDVELVVVICCNGKVVLLVFVVLSSGLCMVEELLLILLIVVNVVIFGYSDIEVDVDGVVCGLYFIVGIGLLYWFVLGLVLVDVCGLLFGLCDGGIDVFLLYQWWCDYYVWVCYVGLLDCFLQVFYVDVFNGIVDLVLLCGWLVMVGMIVSGIVLFLFILIMCECWMSGSEYQVNVVLMMFDDKVICVLFVVWQNGLIGLLVVFCCFVLILLWVWLGVLLVLLVVLLFSLVLLCGGNLWFVLVVSLVGMLLVIVVWVVWWVSVWCWQVNSDVLIGFGNWLCFEQVLQQEYDVGCWICCLFSLIFIDVDYFKCYNDFYGYQGGDDLLCCIVYEIGVYVWCLCDMVVWFGGDEFVLILFDMGVDGVVQVVQDLIVGVQQLEILIGCGDIVWIIFIVGVYIWVLVVQSELWYFFEGVDVVLYCVKVVGCNGYVVDDGGMV